MILQPSGELLFCIIFSNLMNFTVTIMSEISIVRVKLLLCGKGLGNGDCFEKSYKNIIFHKQYLIENSGSMDVGKIYT